MREMTKILLSACTVCALGQGNIARAQNGQAQPSPSTSPTPASPSDASSGTSTSEPSSSQPTPPDEPSSETPTPTSPAVPDSNQPPPPSPPDTTSSTTTTTTTTTVGSTTAAPAPAPAPAPVTEEPTETGNEMFAFNWHNPRLQSGMGVSVLLGGGVAQFRSSTMRDTTSNLGGLWDLHVTFGTHLPLALDLAYVGSATHIGGLPTGNTATLIGSAAEGTLRWNVLPNFAWTPYIFGGVGYQRYDVTGGNVSLSDSGMNSSDNLLSVPAGLGFVWRGNNGLVADVHGTYRFTWFQDLVLADGVRTPANNSSSNFVSLNSWGASASIGYEF